jgi:Fic family protein
MFIPKFTITNSILKNVGVIDASRELISHLTLLPAFENRLRKEAMERSVHHATHLEGNRLGLDQVKEILEGGQVMATPRDLQEVFNFGQAMKYVEFIANHIGPNKPYILAAETILEIHKVVVGGILPPDQVGQFRTKQVVVKNIQTGEISFSPPPAAEVPYLIEDLLNWINDHSSKELHPILKVAIVQFELARIHPFMDGNGRTARAVANLILYLEGYDMKKFCSIEEYFDMDPLKYYVTLQAVSNQKVMENNDRDITPWLEYFVQGFAMELYQVKERVRKLSSDSKVKDRLGDQFELTERQLALLEWLNRHKELRNKDFRKIFPDLSDDTVLREIKFLKQKGMVKKVGGTKKAAYVLS